MAGPTNSREAEGSLPGKCRRPSFPPADADQEHTVAHRRVDRGMRQVVRQFNDALESAIRDLHAVLATTFFQRPVAAQPLDGEVSPLDDDRNVLGAHAGEVGLEEPAFARLVDVKQWLPRAAPL